MAPGLRVGFMIANKKIIERGTLLKQFTDVHTNILAQMIVYEYYKNYDIKKHLAEVSAFYAIYVQINQGKASKGDKVY